MISLTDMSQELKVPLLPAIRTDTLDLFLFTPRAESIAGFLRRLDRNAGPSETHQSRTSGNIAVDTAMILLDAPIQVGAAAMIDFRTNDLADGARIRIMAIACYLAWNLPHSGDSTTEESLSSLPCRASH
jgi:hypothetical protein